VLIVLPGLVSESNLRRSRQLGLGLLDEFASRRSQVFRDHYAGLGEVDRVGVGVVAEDLDPDPIGLEDCSDEVRLEPLAPEYDVPAFYPQLLIPAQRRRHCRRLKAGGGDGVMARSRDHGGVVGAQLQGWDRQARPAGHDFGRAPA
jgi:hypothetical protein